jgi:hypothetical protein
MPPMKEHKVILTEISFGFYRSHSRETKQPTLHPDLIRRHHFAKGILEHSEFLATG